MKTMENDSQDANRVAFDQGYNEAIRIATLYLKEHLEERITGKNEVGDWECEVVTKPSSTKNVFIWDFEKYMKEVATINLKTSDAVLGMIIDHNNRSYFHDAHLRAMAEMFAELDENLKKMEDSNGNK